MKKTSTEDDLKILKVEYLSNRLLDHSQILNLSLDEQVIFLKSSKWRHPPTEDEVKLLEWNISATIVWIVNYEFLGEN